MKCLRCTETIWILGRKLIKIRGSVYAGEIGTRKSKASMADLPIPAALEIRLREYWESPRYKENALGLLFVNRGGRPYSANKLREKKLHHFTRCLSS